MGAQRIESKSSPDHPGRLRRPILLLQERTGGVLFRFCFVYFGLYSLATQIFGSMILIPWVSFRGLGILWPMREITLWVGREIFGITAPLVYAGNSRDTNFFWVQTLLVLAVALIATGVWSALDRKRDNYPSLHKWFRVFIRLGLAAQMFEYGMTKVIPTQFPPPSLITLVTPVGNLSLQGLLWTSVGAAPAYEIFTGFAELLAGVLLLVPRTTMLGAMICLADMVHVFVLNMTYDIGVKIISFHLVLLTLFLLAPEFRRLVDFLFFNRAPGPSSRPQLFRSPRANRVALVAQIFFGLYLIGMQIQVNRVYWYAEGAGSPRSPLYGVWNVEQLSIDGTAGPTALNDYDRRWRRVIFDSPGSMIFQRTDDSFARYGAAIDTTTNTVALTKGSSRNWSARFIFERPAQDQLDLNGEMDGYKIQVKLQRVEFDTFRLLNSDFRWMR